MICVKQWIKELSLDQRIYYLNRVENPATISVHRREIPLKNKIPQATAKRLPLYYRFLTNLHHQGKTRVSSKELSDAVKVDSATIRRDFSYFGALGKKGYGYNVEYLLQFFKQILDQDELTKVALIGVGNLGTALLNYNFLRSNNTKIVMAFDRSKGKVGSKV